MKKFVYTNCILIIIAFFNISAHKSIWPNCNYITQEGKYYCNQFQFLNGSNRTADLKNVFGILFSGENFANNKTFTTTNFLKEDIIKILGEPTEMINENKFIYQLNPDKQNCVAEFEYNTSTKAISCIVRNCN